MSATQLAEPFVLELEGFCCICGTQAKFRAVRDSPLPKDKYRHWFRSGLRCTACDAVPRERALFEVVQRTFPNWRKCRMHECSPEYRGASKRFQTECSNYVKTQFDPALGFGNIHPTRGYRSEDLEHQTFEDESFDLVITQDVFEHLFHPDRAICEIARTLRPGGAHIMTVPLANHSKTSERRAALEDGAVRHLLPPSYHGNPMSHDGSLVTIDWGWDIVDYLTAHSGLSISVFDIDDLSRGISAVHCEVFVCRKLGPPPTI